MRPCYRIEIKIQDFTLLERPYTYVRTPLFYLLVAAHAFELSQ